MIPVVCVVKNERPIDESTFRFLLQFVQPEKRERILRQRLKQNADNMLVGDILAKYVVKREFGIHFSQQQISYGQYGKPYLTRYPNVHFNISHSGQFVVCAVCDVPVGVDVQSSHPFSLALAERCCSKNELNTLKQSVDPSAEFTKIWAMKESYLKMIGTGIMKDLYSVDTTKFHKMIKTYIMHGCCIALAWTEFLRSNQ